MAKAKTESIGRRELEIMQYVADRYPIGVREVAEHMSEVHGLARTSVLTVMERLREKGFLRRKRDGRRWVYSPKEEKASLLRRFVRDFYQNTLQGTLSPFVAYLSDEIDATDDQIDELKQLVRSLEEKKQTSSRKRGQ